MNKEKFFIAIGPPKTGTTWLYGVLNKHPEVSLPRDKEIRYFWAKEYLGKNNALTNIFGRHWHFQSKRSKSIPKIKSSIKKILKGKPIDSSNLFWHIKYLMYNQTDKWYESLFPKNQLSGDITPKYCELSETYILKIKTLIPNAKIIISLRDPVDREWSRVKMNLLKKQGKDDIEKVNKEDVINHFKDSLQHQANDYTKLINSWLKYFDKDQIMIFYYDELLEDSNLLFNRICDFLNIEPIQIDNLDKKYNKGIIQEIPDNYRDILIELNYQFIEKFASNYPNKYNINWLARYKSAQQ